jgi:hypothetical protein
VVEAGLEHLRLIEALNPVDDDPDRQQEPERPPVLRTQTLRGAREQPESQPEGVRTEEAREERRCVDGHREPDDP